MIEFRRLKLGSLIHDPRPNRIVFRFWPLWFAVSNTPTGPPVAQWGVRL